MQSVAYIRVSFNLARLVLLLVCVCVSLHAIDLCNSFFQSCILIFKKCFSMDQGISVFLAKLFLSTACLFGMLQDAHFQTHFVLKQYYKALNIQIYDTIVSLISHLIFSSVFFTGVLVPGCVIPVVCWQTNKQADKGIQRDSYFYQIYFSLLSLLHLIMPHIQLPQCHLACCVCSYHNSLHFLYNYLKNGCRKVRQMLLKV